MEKRAYSEMSLLEFQDKFANEEACKAHLIQTRWPEGFKCPHCGETKHCYKPSREVFECYGCWRLTSITSGTLFHGSKVPLRKWFWCIYWMATSKKGIPALYLQKQLQLGSYNTAWMMRHKIQLAMMNRDAQYQLGGIVETDEIWIGGKQTFENRREFGPNKTPFVIAVEEDRAERPKFLKLEEVESIYEDHVMPVLEKNITPKSVLKTDGAGVYVNAVYKNEYTLERSVGIENPSRTHEHLKWVNIITSNLKRFLLSTHHGVFRKYRSAYLGEFAYRFNRRYWPHQAFDRLLFANIFMGPAPLRV